MASGPIFVRIYLIINKSYSWMGSYASWAGLRRIQRHREREGEADWHNCQCADSNAEYVLLLSPCLYAWLSLFFEVKGTSFDKEEWANRLASSFDVDANLRFHWQYPSSSSIQPSLSTSSFSA